MSLSKRNYTLLKKEVSFGCIRDVFALLWNRFRMTLSASWPSSQSPKKVSSFSIAPKSICTCNFQILARSFTFRGLFFILLSFVDVLKPLKSLQFSQMKCTLYQGFFPIIISTLCWKKPTLYWNLRYIEIRYIEVKLIGKYKENFRWLQKTYVISKSTLHRVTLYRGITVDRHFPLLY